MRIKFLICAFATVLGVGFSAAGTAADMYVIANDTLHMTPAELREVFLGERQFASGRRLVPVDNAAIQKEFVNRVVGIDAAKYGTVWAKKGFREGLNPPSVMPGDQEVIATVRATPGAIGYVSHLAPGVHLVDKY